MLPVAEFLLQKYIAGMVWSVVMIKNDSLEATILRKVSLPFIHLPLGNE